MLIPSALQGPALLNHLVKRWWGATSKAFLAQGSEADLSVAPRWSSSISPDNALQCLSKLQVHHWVKDAMWWWKRFIACWSLPYRKHFADLKSVNKKCWTTSSETFRGWLKTCSNLSGWEPFQIVLKRVLHIGSLQKWHCALQSYQGVRLERARGQSLWKDPPDPLIGLPLRARG